MLSAIETAIYFLVPILAASAVAIYLFARWIKSQSDMPADTQIKYWEVFGKNMTVLVGIISGTLLIVKYLDEKNIAENQLVREKQIEFKQKQLAAELERHKEFKTNLSRARAVAAQIAETATRNQGGDISTELLLEFNTLYYADLIGIEIKQGEVEGSMVSVRNELEKMGKVGTGELQKLSLKLSTSVRNELVKSEEAVQKIRQELSDLASGKSP